MGSPAPSGRAERRQPATNAFKGKPKRPVPPFLRGKHGRLAQTLLSLLSLLVVVVVEDHKCSPNYMPTRLRQQLFLFRVLFRPTAQGEQGPQTTCYS